MTDEEKKPTSRRLLLSFLKSLFKLSNPLTPAFWMLMALGLGLLFLSPKIPDPDWAKTIHEIAVLSLTVTPILFVYEGVLKLHHQTELKSILKSVIKEANFPNEVRQIFKRTLAIQSQNLIDTGVADAFANLDPVHLRERIKTCKNCEITVLKIWMPYVNDDFIDKKLLLESVIKNNCAYRIIVCDPAMEEPLQRRAIASEKFNLEDYKTAIFHNIDFFQQVWIDLKKKGKENNIQLRLNTGFLSTSLMGFDDYFIFGLYLNCRFANKGMQFKIVKDTEEGSIFYQELKGHFEFQWRNAGKEIKFSNTSYSIDVRQPDTAINNDEDQPGHSTASLNGNK